MRGPKIFTLPVFNPSNLPDAKNQVRFPSASIDSRSANRDNGDMAPLIIIRDSQVFNCLFSGGDSFFFAMQLLICFMCLTDIGLSGIPAARIRHHFGIVASTTAWSETLRQNLEKPQTQRRSSHATRRLHSPHINFSDEVRDEFDCPQNPISVYGGILYFDRDNCEWRSVGG